MDRLINKFKNYDPVGLLMFITGVSSLATAISKPNWLQYEFLDMFPGRASKTLLVVTGFSLIFLSQQMAQKKKNAWYLSIVLLVFLLSFSFLHAIHPTQIVLYALLLGYLSAKKDIYVVRSDYISFKRSVSIFMLQILVIFVFFASTITIIDQHEFGRNLTTKQTINVTANALSEEKLPQYVILTKRDDFLLDLLRLSILSGFFVVVWNLFRPIALNQVSQRYDRNKAKQILKRYSNSPEDYFKIYPHDKHYFFYGGSFIAFSVVGGVALVLDGPTGKPVLLGKLRTQFYEYCILNGWQISVIHCDEKEAKNWKRRGLETILVGHEAIVDIANFIEKTSRNKHFRHVLNKAQKSDLQTEVWKAPLSDIQIEQLRKISDSWVASGRKEYTFIMGQFSPEYQRSSDTIVLNEKNSVVAYCNFLPQYQTNSASIDHMRQVEGLPNVAMHFLILKAIEYADQKGYKKFNLGLSPLAKIEDQAKSYTQKGLVVIKKYGGNFYSFAGLEQFKNKFVPTWEPMFIVYQKGPLGLVKTFQALNSAISVKNDVNPLVRRLIIPLGILSALCYASFPLAFLLTPSTSLKGLVSTLAQSGAPYAWLYNLLDIVSAFALILATSLSLYFVKSSRKLRIALVALLISALGALLAAVVSLPPGFEQSGHISISDLKSSDVLVHGLASFINTSGFIVAIFLWLTIFWQKSKSRKLLGISIISIGVIGLMMELFGFNIGPYTQRAFIALYALWLSLFFFDIS